MNPIKTLEATAVVIVNMKTIATTATIANLIREIRNLITKTKKVETSKNAIVEIEETENKGPNEMTLKRRKGSISATPNPISENIILMIHSFTEL